MREIKFRYVMKHTTNGRLWIPPFRFPISEIENGASDLWRIIGSGGWQIHTRNQYIGMKDVDKIEIYQGDIVKAKLEGQGDGIMTYGYESWVYCPKTIWGEVRIRIRGGAGILVRKIILEGTEPKNQSPLKLGRFIRIRTEKDKVIGNIYENPELIKGE